MNGRLKIKTIIAMRATTITEVAKKLKERTGKNYTFKSLTCKMQKGSLSLDEAFLIADILDCKLSFIDKFENKVLF